MKRFTTMLHNSAEAMELRTLIKMLKLMTNILQDYFSKVIQQHWGQLAEALALQSGALSTIIQREKGPRRKKNLQQALDGLNAALEQRSISAIQEAA